MADYDPFAVHEEEEEETQPPPPPPPATAPVAATTTDSGPAASSTADSEAAPQAYDPFAAVEEDADPPATTATTDMDAAPTTTADATAAAATAPAPAYDSSSEEEEEGVATVRKLKNLRAIDRLIDTPGAKYLNLNPYYVLGIEWGREDKVATTAYRKLSRLLHPDKNANDPKAAEAFDLVNRAYKAVTDEKNKKRLEKVVSMAQARVDKAIDGERVRARAANQPFTEKTGAEYVNMMKLEMHKVFAEIDVGMQKKEAKENARKQAEAEEKQEKKKKRKIEADETKVWEDDREMRVAGWRSFAKKKKKKLKAKRRKLTHAEKLTDSRFKVV